MSTELIEARRLKVQGTLEALDRAKNHVDDLERAVKSAQADLDMAENPPSWRNTFDGEHRRWGYITECETAAKSAGYRYFTWGGLVYITASGDRTDILASDL